MNHDWQNINACTVCGNEVDLESLLWENGGLCPSCEDRPPFVRKSNGRMVVLTFLPEMTWKSEAKSVEVLRATIQDGVILVLNMSCVPVPSSLLLGMLISARSKVRSVGGTLRLCGLCLDTAEVFQTMQLHRLFDIYPDEYAAVTGY